MRLSADFLHRPIAHRGLHDQGSGAPENSLEAVERAKRGGMPIELDVRRLADETVAVFHDLTLDRMTEEKGPLSRLDGNQARKVALAGSNQKIPLLVEVLELVRGEVPLLIELKVPEGEVGRLEPLLVRSLEGYEGAVAVQSFHPGSMGWFRKNAPHFCRGQLSSDFRDTELPRWKRRVLQHLLLNRISRPHFIAYDVEVLPIRAVRRQRQRGLPVLGWTVTSKEQERAARKWCDNIIFEGYRPG